MQSNYGAEENAPHHHGPAADDQQYEAEHSYRHPVPLADECMELVFAKIGHIWQQHSRVIVQNAAGNDPTHVRPEAAVAWRMRVAVNVCVLVVDAMRRYPEKWPAFQRQGCAQREEVLNPLVSLESAMSE